MIAPRLNYTPEFNHIYDVINNQFIPCSVEVELVANQHISHTIKYLPPRNSELTIKLSVNADIVPDAKWALGWINSTFYSNGLALPKDYKRDLFISKNSNYKGYAIYSAYIKSYTRTSSFNEMIELELGCDHYETDVSSVDRFKALQRDYKIDRLFE